MFSSADIEILRDLYLHPKGIDMFYFYSKYNLYPNEIANTVIYFKDLEYIFVQKNLIFLTKKGRKWVFENRQKLFLSNRNQYWKELKSKIFVAFDKSVYQTYIPNIKKIDKELFIKKNGKN